MKEGKSGEFPSVMSGKPRCLDTLKNFQMKEICGLRHFTCTRPTCMLYVEVREIIETATVIKRGR